MGLHAAAESDPWAQIAAAAERFAASRDDANAFIVWDHRPGRRGQTLALPRPEERTDLMVEVFARGHCHSLALAFAEQGYQVRGIVSIHTEKAFVPHKTRHYFAVDPTDPTFGIDIRGRRPIEEITAEYKDTRCYEIADPWRAVQASVDSGTYLPVDIQAGRVARGWVTSPSN